MSQDLHPSADDFALFGLPRRFALDEAELDARWRMLQARVHPDRAAHEGPAAREQALQWSLRVNEARARLKHPLQRAELLCRLLGAPPAERGSVLSPALLMQQMDWREALESATGLAAVEALAGEVAAHERTLVETLRRLLDERADAHAAQQPLQQLMFVARLREDIEARLEGLAA